MFTQERGDEAAAKLAGKFARVAREILEARGGSLIELRGDEAMAVFGSPRQAIRAAVDLQARLVEETIADPSLPLGVGIGLDAGEAVPVEGGFRGGALNLAARLCGQAGPGEVLASREVVHLARRVEGLQYVDGGEVHLKGLSKPVPIIRIVPQAGDPAARLMSAIHPASPSVRPVADSSGTHPTAPLSTFESPLYGRRHRPASLLSGRRLAVAGVALLLLVAGVIVVATRGGDEQEPKVVSVSGTALAAVGLQSGLPVGAVRLGGRPSGVAVGAGAVWVTDSLTGSVTRIHPTTRRILQVIPVDNGPTGIAAGLDAVWVANSDAGFVTRINPETNTVVQRIRVGNGPAGVAVGEGAVWVTNSFDATVSKIDQATGRVLATIGVGGTPRGVDVGEGAVWVANQASGTVSQIDASTGRVIRQITVGTAPTGIAVGEGAVWVTNNRDGTVSRIETEPGTVSATGRVGKGPTGIAVGSGSVWVIDEIDDSLSRLDPVTLERRETVTLQTVPQAVAVGIGEGVLWVAGRAPTDVHRGGTLRVVIEEGLTEIDPALSFDVVGWSILSMTNDGLVAFKRVGGAEGVTLVPNLAATIPLPTDGGRAYTFVLRPGVHYSNGDPVEVEDIKRAIERGFRIDLGTAQFFLDRLVGADRCLQEPAECDLTEGISVDPSANTVTFNLTAPDPDFVHKLALPFAWVVPEGTPPTEGLDMEPIPATGPYMIDAYTPGEVVRLVRNPMFREWSPAARPDGFPDEIVVEGGVGAEAALEAVLAGDADWMGDQPPPERMEEINTRYTAQRHPFALPATFFASLNTRVPPFDDIRVRKAFNLAVDRARVVELLGGPLQAQLTCQVLPPNFPGYRPYCPYTARPDPSGEWTGPDLGRARELVDASGTEGVAVTLWSLRPRFGAVGSYLTEVLDSLGYRASLEERDDPMEYFNQVNDSRNGVQAGLIGWFTDLPIPSNMVQLLQCDTYRTADPRNLNASQFCDPGVDAIIEQALDLQLSEPSTANKLWTDVDRRLVDAAPWVPLFNPRSVDVVSKRVGNYQRSPQWGILLDQLWIV